MPGESQRDESSRPASIAGRGAFLGELRRRLKQLAQFHLDRRIRSRVEASDVVQDAFLEAAGQWDQLGQLSGDHLYRLLRKMVRGRTVDCYRRHLRAERRSVLRERGSGGPAGANGSRMSLEDLLIAATPPPSEQVKREELLALVRAALQELPAPDRELLVRRHLKQQSVEEIAASEQTSRTVITSRHLRALRRLRHALRLQLQQGGQP